MKVFFKFLYIGVLLLNFNGVFAQLNSGERRVLKNADSYFENEEFRKALPLYLKIDAVTDDYTVKYKIGACYLNSKYEKIKAIPYLEDVSRTTDIEVPVIVHYDLGNLYHYTYRFNEAIEQYKKFIKAAEKNNVEKSLVEDAKRMITICNNAIEITTKPFKAEVEILEYPVNTMESEYNPMITADDNTLVYMRKVDNKRGGLPVTHIMITHKNESGLWNTPSVLTIENEDKYKGFKVQLAGLSPDGQTIFLNIGKGLNQDVYKGHIENTTIVNIEKLNKNINTPFYEGRVSISPDGTELYFVSDRPGGFGGTDIYKSTRKKSGDWGKPENLGEVINTEYDENSPFMHPDGMTLFFSSRGHKTIGGNDIFKSKFEKGKWSEPENLGFPNSTKDDLYFVLNANGQIGYFSSSKNNIYNKHNIFRVNLKDPIPLTLVKGTIKMGNPPKPGYVDIKVYDKETGERVKYVYNPDPETGKYLMIFPPAKNYNIIISSGDYLPQMINIYVPYQTYFYELYQEITLEPITLNNNTIGERITVNNTFYDLYKTAEADSIITDDKPKQPKYYEHLLELVENIIQTTDTMRISYVKTEQVRENEKGSIESLLNLIEDAIETTDPVTLSILDANAEQKDKVKATHFYVEGDKSKSLQMQIIGDDTLYTATPVNSENRTDQYAIKQKSESYSEESTLNVRNTPESKRKYLYRINIYYELNNDDIPEKYISSLLEVSDILLNNKNLGAEIYGYTDDIGAEKYNLSLSRKRAQKVLKFFIDHHIDQQKLITKGLGEDKKNTGKDAKYQRRVEINIFEVTP